MALQNAIDALIVRLWDKGAVAVDTREGGGFRHKHHLQNPNEPLSPIKIHLCTPEVRSEGKLDAADVKTLAEVMWQYTNTLGLSFTGIAGIPNVGTPLARGMIETAYHDNGRDVAELVLKKEVGLVRVTRDLPRGERVLLTDDLIHRSVGKQWPVECLRAEDYKVADCVVFADYEKGGKETLARAQVVKLHAATTVSHILKIGYEKDKLSEHDFKTVLEYLFVPA